MAESTQIKQSIAPRRTAKTVFSLLRKESKVNPIFTQDTSTRLELGLPMQEKLDQARIRELQFKHIFRICFSLFASALLVWQNYEVFSIVDQAFITHQLQGLQLIFGTLIAETLTETYFILRIIVNFVFSISDYHYQRRN